MSVEKNDPRTELWQWDLDRQVKIRTTEAITRVDFAQEGVEPALPVDVEEFDGYFIANVPNIQLQETKNITVYVKKDGATIGSWKYPIVKREKPSDYVYTETEIRSFDKLAQELRERIDGEVADSVVAYLKENGLINPTTAKIGEVTLLAEKWQGNNNVYSQIVTIDGVTKNSQVDLTPSVEQLAIFYEKDLTFATENENGIVTVYAVGQKPTNDYTIQVTITEVSYE